MLRIALAFLQTKNYERRPHGNSPPRGGVVFFFSGEKKFSFVHEDKSFCDFFFGKKNMVFSPFFPATPPLNVSQSVSQSIRVCISRVVFFQSETRNVEDQSSPDHRQLDGVPLQHELVQLSAGGSLAGKDSQTLYRTRCRRSLARALGLAAGTFGGLSSECRQSAESSSRSGRLVQSVSSPLLYSISDGEMFTRYKISFFILKCSTFL